MIQLLAYPKTLKHRCSLSNRRQALAQISPPPKFPRSYTADSYYKKINPNYNLPSMTNQYRPAFLRISERGNPLSASLRQAFADEIKLADYLSYIWYTAIVAIIVISGLASYHNDAFVLSYLIPTDGHWHARDISGNLYAETWSTIIVNALQLAFCSWGCVLFTLGLKRLFMAHKFFVGCLSTGLAFMTFGYFLPSMAQPILQMLADRMPFLMN